MDFLKKNKGLARGMLNAPEHRAKSAELWEEIKTKLNSLGPPIKTREGWKKVINIQP